MQIFTKWIASTIRVTQSLNWQFLIIHILICYQIWILKLKIRSLTDTRFCFASSKIRMGYREWVNAVEKLCDCCHSQYWWPSLARITQPFYRDNSLLITHSNVYNNFIFRTEWSIEKKCAQPWCTLKFHRMDGIKKMSYHSFDKYFLASPQPWVLLHILKQEI